MKLLNTGILAITLSFSLSALSYTTSVQSKTTKTQSGGPALATLATTGGKTEADALAKLTDLVKQEQKEIQSENELLKIIITAQKHQLASTSQFQIEQGQTTVDDSLSNYQEMKKTLVSLQSQIQPLQQQVKSLPAEITVFQDFSKKTQIEINSALNEIQQKQIQVNILGSKLCDQKKLKWDGHKCIQK